MEKTWRKIELGFDILYNKVFGCERGLYVSSDLYNMCFEENYGSEDVAGFLKFCQAHEEINPWDLFDRWYESTLSKSKK